MDPKTLFPLWPYDLAALLILPALHFGFRDRSARTKTLVLGIFAFVNFAAWLINDICGWLAGAAILTMLPLQLCNIAVFLIPLAMVLKRRLLYDFLFYVCALGAFAALLFPSSNYIGQVWAPITASFFVNHFAIFAIPLLHATWGIHRPEPTVGRLAALSLLVFALASTLHLLNLFLGKTLGVEADYFFTIISLSAAANPVFAIFAGLIPYDLFYLLPALPILWVAAPLMALPWNWKRWFGRPAGRRRAA